MPAYSEEGKPLYTLTKPIDQIVAEGSAVLSGTDVVSSEAKSYNNDYNQREYIVSLQFSTEGAQKFADATGEAAARSGLPGTIAIYYDNELLSVPNVQERIAGGSAQISGMRDINEATNLAQNIRIGGLKLELQELRSNVVGAQLGTDAIRTSLMAGLIGLILVILLMVVVYRLPGFASSIALVLYCMMVILCITLFEMTLTLPGIAGIILSIGMGVDCNIITAERIKEELAKGKSVEKSIKAGYENAFSAILDGNLTLVIVAIILMGAFGTNTNPITKFLDATIFRPFGATTEGFIYSFGFTLVAGVVLNFIMGVFAARLMNTSLAKFAPFQKATLYGYNEKTHKPVKTLKFAETKKTFFIISAVLIVLSICTTFTGVDVAIDFKGGTIVSYSYSGDLNENDCKAGIEEILGTSVTLQKGESFDSDTNILTVSFSYDESLTLEQQENMLAKVQEIYPDNNVNMLESNEVSPSSGREFFGKCIVAVIFAAVLLIIYIALRFKKISGWSAGVFTICALLHDIIITYGSFVLCGFEINSNFMAVILTIFGYSINNTIVVYDRIRENENIMDKKASIAELVNVSASQTLRRSIRTSITTLTTMIVISVVAYIFHVESILSFSVPMAFGLLAGTFSSQCIAPTLWVWWNEKRGNKTIGDCAKAAK